MKIFKMLMLFVAVAAILFMQEFQSVANGDAISLAATNIFDIGTMLAAVNVWRTPSKFISNLFFNKKITEARSKTVTIDIVKNGRNVAPYVSRRDDPTVVNKEGFQSSEYEPPYISIEDITHAEDELQERNPGELIFSGGITPMQRAAERLTNDLRRLDDMISRREEIQAVQAVLTGTSSILNAAGNEIVADINFRRNSGNTVTLSTGARWNQGTATIVKNIMDWKRLVSRGSGYGANVLILGTEAMDAFIANTEVKAIFDNLRINPGELDLSIAEQFGVEAYGTFLGLRVFCYSEQYYDAVTSTVKSILDSKSVIVGSTLAETDRAYGAISNYKAGVSNAPTYRFPFSYVSENGKKRSILMESAPLFIPSNVDAFVGATVLS
jgi:hypothetical protein